MGSKLSALESLILQSTRDRLSSVVASLWDKQIATINKVQRLPEGVEVNFYRKKTGHPSFDSQIAFANDAEELLVATVKITVPEISDQLTARVWSVRGFLFSIEYKGSVNYFTEAAAMEEPPTFQVDCELEADLSQTQERRSFGLQGQP